MGHPEEKSGVFPRRVTNTSDVHVAELNVTVAPMLRYDGWKVVRPFVIPIGVAFLVNSPPSNDTTYLDIGLHFAGGFDFVLIDEISLGVDVRYTYAFDQSNTNNGYLSTGAYAGVNFWSLTADKKQQPNPKPCAGLRMLPSAREAWSRRQQIAYQILKFRCGSELP